MRNYKPLSSLDHSKDERDAHRIAWLEAETERTPPFPRDVDALIERASWAKAAATYLKQMAEVEYAMTMGGDAILATLDRVIGLPDPEGTLECVDHLLDVAADYVSAAAALVERADGGDGA